MNEDIQPLQASATENAGGWNELQPKSTIDQEEINRKSSEPGFLNILLSNFFRSITGFILNFLTIITTPFQELYHKLIKLYFHYQQQGKAPVFLMTVAGLITLTFGLILFS